MSGEYHKPDRAIIDDPALRNLDLIDGALRDYGTSTDAMRWTPEPDEVDANPFDAWMRATSGGTTSAEAGIGRATETVTLDNRAGRFTVPPGHVRIECEGTVIYEGPIGEWPPVTCPGDCDRGAEAGRIAT